MKYYDVIIVGAGPVGGYVAGSISKHGYTVALLEEHHEIGRPIQCAGLISHRVFDILGFKCGVLNEISGATLYSPSNKSLIFKGKKSKACVIDRAAFDQEIVKRALDCGTDLLLGAKVTAVNRHGRGITVKVKEDGLTKDVGCKLVIGSDGVGSIVARDLGFSQPTDFLSGFGAECLGVENLDLDCVNIFVGNKIAPGFFAWIIPTEEGARIGLCTSRGDASTFQYFKKLLTHPQIKKTLKDAKIERYIAGLIPLGPMKKIHADRAMLVGDAAAQVKPLSGGGVYMGLLCGNHCANVAARALKNDDVSEKSLKEYPKLVSNDIGKELKRANLLRKIFVELKDAHLEEGFEILGNEKIVKLIATHGDIDYPSGLTKAVLQKAPKLVKFAGPVLRSLI